MGMKLGFIGCGNMAKAMIGGIISSKILSAEEIIASDSYAEGLANTNKELGINITADNKEVAMNSHVVVLSIKPQYYDNVIKEISSVIKDETIIVTICNILSGFGKAEVVEERMMDAVMAVSGSSPAYVFMFIEAMADAAVMEGMPRDKAYKFAAQAVYGSAKMVMETGKHPGELKDMVCSPGGTTIEAVRVLEERGLRSSVIEAMKACVEKAGKM